MRRVKPIPERDDTEPRTVYVQVRNAPALPPIEPALRWGDPS
jgi:hypothetical protein